LTNLVDCLDKDLVSDTIVPRGSETKDEGERSVPCVESTHSFRRFVGDARCELCGVKEASNVSDQREVKER